MTVPLSSGVMAGSALEMLSQNRLLMIYSQFQLSMMMYFRQSQSLDGACCWGCRQERVLVFLTGWFIIRILLIKCNKMDEPSAHQSQHLAQNQHQANKRWQLSVTSLLRQLLNQINHQTKFSAPISQNPHINSPLTFLNSPFPCGWSFQNCPRYCQPFDRYSTPCPSFTSSLKFPQYFIHSSVIFQRWLQSYYYRRVPIHSLQRTPQPSSRSCFHSPQQAILPLPQQRTPLPYILFLTHSPQYFPPQLQQKVPKPCRKLPNLQPQYRPSLRISLRYSGYSYIYFVFAESGK